MHKWPVVSIILPIRNEAAFLPRCLEALLAQDYPGEMEILLADGRSTDNTRAILQQFILQHPTFVLVDNPGQIVPCGMNLALKQARGEIIARVDGHTLIAPDYVRNCVIHLLNREAEGVGGAMETVGETPLAQLIALAMCSPFGVGNSAFRTTSNQTLLTDTVPFAAYRRETIVQNGLYDEELVRNQDDEYNFRLRARGGKILLAADVHSVYFSRASLRGVAKQYYQYGYWKVRVLQKHPRQMSLRQFAPPLLTLGLALSALLACFAPIRSLAVVLPSLYLLANLLASGWVLLRSRPSLPPRVLVNLPLVFAALHLGYGFGFLQGLLHFWNRWGDKTGQIPAWEKPASNPDLQRLQKEYSAREQRLQGDDRYSWLNPAQAFLLQGRARAALQALRKQGLRSLENLDWLEIGCGNGGALKEWAAYGASPRRMVGVDLLDRRLRQAQTALPLSLLARANAAALPLADARFDVVFQYTALSSLLDASLRQAVCAEMRRVLRPGGVILSYDFWWNPLNPQTRGLTPAEITRLFPGCRIHFQRISLAAPLARLLLPRAWGLAAFFESLQIFNTHYLALITPIS